ncbi:hypothetical protein Adt_41960 [Abeliophyllum distichum]|uniref:Uncharacterized protein n=1 Tax=Abeliophyllum distichum TaxID=126358 RepID=A0ABD1PR66_9LAMI
MWSSPSGRGTCMKFCSMRGASCNVAESQWKRHLCEALHHGRSKLQCGRIPVGEALARSFAPWEEQAARWLSPVGEALTQSIAPWEEQAAMWPSPSRRGTCVKRCSMV